MIMFIQMKFSFSIILKREKFKNIQVIIKNCFRYFLTHNNLFLDDTSIETLIFLHMCIV